ncbi:MAG: MBL fold metallo-hydrolase [Acidimicrobiia bacterium]|nr:MBL fold metallo-hydrolase [Acidimicrobiia bacterium]
MTRHVLAALICTALIAQPALAQDAKTVIANASKAMGADGVTSVTYYGSGANYNLGQNNNAQGPWPRVNLNDYRRTIDFNAPASRATAVTWAAPPQGTPAAQGAFNQVITPQNQQWAQQLEIWVTPWGFLKGAAANNATSRTQTVNGRRYHVVTWNAPITSPGGQPYRVVGYVNAQTNLVDRVDTWVENPVFGDLQVETHYSHWRDGLNGFKFPSDIQQRRAGWPTFDAQILSAEANPPNLQALITPPPPPAGRGGGPGGAPGGGGQPPAVTATAEKLAEGVYAIKGGYVALAVEFNDHIVLFEPGPQNEARAAANIAEVKRVIPNKPIRYGVLSHHHFDHTSGLPAAVAEGITLVTHENNRLFFERALNSPRTLAPDAIAKSGRKAVVEGMRDRRVFTDGTRTLEIHEVKGLPHADGLLMAYLPKERILAYADMFNAPAPDAKPAPPTAGHVVMAANVDRLKLDVDTLVSVHAPVPDRPLRMTELRAGLKNPGTN